MEAESTQSARFNTDTSIAEERLSSSGQKELSDVIDARELRQVLGAFVTGVTVMTTIDRDGNRHGLTVNSFSSVSLDPPLILWSQSLTAPSHPVFRSAERFAVNILADDQVAVSAKFARGDGDKFAGVSVRTGMGNVPLIVGSAAWLQCRLVASYPGGDHLLLIGQVERIERTDRPSLVFGGGRYLVAHPHDGVGLTGGKSSSIAKLQAVRIATRGLAELSRTLDATLGLGVWGNLGPTIVRWEESSTPVSENLRAGFVLPVLRSATGLAFAAWLPGEMTKDFMDVESEAGGLLGPDRELPHRLAQIRSAGVARVVSTDAFSDVYGGAIDALSVPVFDKDGDMILALTSIDAPGRLNSGEEDTLVAQLKQFATEITRRLSQPGG